MAAIVASFEVFEVFEVVTVVTRVVVRRGVAQSIHQNTALQEGCSDSVRRLADWYDIGLVISMSGKHVPRHIAHIIISSFWACEKTGDHQITRPEGR